MKRAYDLDCNLAEVLNIFGDKWTMLILHRILKGKNTFKEIEDNLEAIPTNILSNRLKFLEEKGLVYQELYNEHPPRYKYYPSEKGKDFLPVLNSMIIWGSKNLDTCKRHIVDKECSRPVRIAYYCEECKELIGEDRLLVKDRDA